MKKIFMAMAVILLSAAMFTGCKNNGNDPSGPTLSTGTPSLKYMFNCVTASIDLPIDTIKAKFKNVGWTEDGEALVLTKSDVTYKITLTKLAKKPTLVGGITVHAIGTKANFSSALLYESATQIPFAQGFSFGPNESVIFKEMKYGNSEQDCSTQTDWSTLSNYASNIKNSEYVSLYWTGASGGHTVKQGCTTSLEAKRVVENGGASFYVIGTCDRCYE